MREGLAGTAYRHHVPLSAGIGPFTRFNASDVGLAEEVGTKPAAEERAGGRFHEGTGPEVRCGGHRGDRAGRGGPDMVPR